MEEQNKATKWQGKCDLNKPLDVTAEDFVKALGYSGADNVYCRAFDDTPAKDQTKAANRQVRADYFTRMLPELQKLNADKCGIFIAVNGGNSDKETKALNKCRAQFMEIDTLPLEEQLQKIQQFALEPSIIVRTRKSLHTYWLLKDGSIKNFRKVQLQLCAYFHSDTALQNESRVMRLPGFDHCKQEPVQVVVIKFDPELKYTQQELANLLPQPAKEESTTELPELTDSTPGLFTEGNRNNALLKLGGHLRAAGCNAEEIASTLQHINAESGNPLPEKELNTCIKQSLKYNAEQLQEQMRLNRAIQDFAEQMQTEEQKQGDFYADFLQTVKTDAYKPYPTECDFFDNALGGGIIRQSLLLLLAAPATGKTTFCQQIAEEMARHGKQVFYINLEMSRQQMLAKAISYRLAKKNKGNEITTINVLQGYDWTAEQSRLIQEELELYKQDTAPNIRYHSRPNGEKMSIEKLKGILYAMGEKYKEKGEPAPAVVVDYLHLLTSEERGKDTAEMLKEATDSLKQYAINYNTFVILISATNRESNKGGKITLESGRDSSALEYTGDYVLSLQYTAIEDGIIDITDKKKMQELQRSKWRKMTMTVLKNRFGIQGRQVQMWYKPATNIFYSRGSADFLQDPDIEEIEQKLRQWAADKKDRKANSDFKKTGKDWDELTGDSIASAKKGTKKA